MLLKGKRTLDSFINSISRHLTSEGDWEIEDEDPDNFGDIIFGAAEWVAKTAMDKHDVLHGVELFNEQYNDVELAVVEKAIALLEGIEWSKETVESLKEPAPRSRRARDGERRSDAEE